MAANGVALVTTKTRASVDKPEESASRTLVAPMINPFENKSVQQMTLAAKLKAALGCLVLLPLRLLMLGFFLMVCSVSATIAVAGLPVQQVAPQPVTDKWRLFFFRVGRSGIRGVLFSLGFVRIHVKGTPPTPKEAPIIVVAPHSTVLDWCPVIWKTYGSFVSADTNLKYPFISIGLRALQCILVSRRDKGAKRAAVEEIRRRAHSDGEWPPTIMFPEGTTTNRRCLVTFKAGAFVPGAPVQPVALRYRCDGFDPSWVTDGPGLKTLMFLLLTQWWGELEMTYLPIVTPTEEEKQDPERYAVRVRSEVGRYLRIPYTEHTVEDMLLQLNAKKAGLPPSVGVVEFAKMQKKLGLTLDSATKFLRDFSSMVKARRDGKVTLDDFCNYLNVVPTNEVKELFEAYDASGDDLLDFREYIVGMTLITAPKLNEGILREAFNLFNPDSGGTVERESFRAIVRGAMVGRGFSVDESDAVADRVVNDVDLDRDGMITYNEFATCIKSKPQYANLLSMTFADSEKQEGDDFSTAL